MAPRRVWQRQGGGIFTQTDRGRGRFTNRPYANNGPPMTVQRATFPVGAVREPPVRRGYVFVLILARV